METKYELVILKVNGLVTLKGGWAMGRWWREELSLQGKWGAREQRLR